MMFRFKAGRNFLRASLNFIIAFFIVLPCGPFVITFLLNFRVHHPNIFQHHLHQYDHNPVLSFPYEEPLSPHQKPQSDQIMLQYVFVPHLVVPVVL